MILYHGTTYKRAQSIFKDRAIKKDCERFFTEEEAEYVRDNDGDPVSFAKGWVRKEAYSKYTGKGLSDFANFSVSDGERLNTKVNGVTVKKFTVTFPGSNEYIFALAGSEN